jgi:hypothetical protein
VEWYRPRTSPGARAACAASVRFTTDASAIGATGRRPRVSMSGRTSPVRSPSRAAFEVFVAAVLDAARYRSRDANARACPNLGAHHHLESGGSIALTVAPRCPGAERQDISWIVPRTTRDKREQPGQVGGAAGNLILECVGLVRFLRAGKGRKVGERSEAYPPSPPYPPMFIQAVTLPCVRWTPRWPAVWRAPRRRPTSPSTSTDLCSAARAGSASSSPANEAHCHRRPSETLRRPRDR